MAQRRAKKRRPGKVEKDQPRPLSVSDVALQRSRGKPVEVEYRPFAAALHPKSATPPRSAQMASDSSISESALWAQAALNGAIAEGQAFLGYPYLSLLAQRSEYRRISEVLAMHMTRRWIKLKSVGGDKGKADKLKELEKELERLNAREIFREAAELDGFFGRSHIYVDTSATDNPDELRTSLCKKDGSINQNKIGKGRLVRLKSVEAVWCYPADYNSNDPLSPEWYSPQSWFVQGKQLHVSRLLTFVGRQVPDLLKPAYSFGGLSLSQMTKPYIDNWLTTRQSVSDLVKAFSTMVLGTNLGDQLNAKEGGDLFKRIDLFNNLRTNRGTMVVDKENEELKNIAVPLGSLDKLQAQSQEHMAAPSGIPLIFLLGITPSGLNASSEGEIRAFYDTIHAGQEYLFRPNLTTVFQMAQLNIWGEVDADITFDFVKLWTPSDEELADIRKTDAETDDKYYSMGAVSADEVRHKLAADPDSPYQLEVEGDPEPPAPEDLMGPGEKEAAAAELAAEQGGPPGVGKGNGKQPPAAQ